MDMDNTADALTLINILYEKGELNEETYRRIRDKYPEYRTRLPVKFMDFELETKRREK